MLSSLAIQDADSGNDNNGDDSWGIRAGTMKVIILQKREAPRPWAHEIIEKSKDNNYNDVFLPDSR